MWLNLASHSTKWSVNSPDIRVDKVERVKAEIAEGRFHVNSDKLAEKILKDVITDSKFLG